ncbi:hypothetical protein F5888DRAFT_1847206 [Russula emetica]|nr:hypothetical protein F5888DRAFT_1847206 [Russula emetica]
MHVCAWATSSNQVKQVTPVDHDEQFLPRYNIPASSSDTTSDMLGSVKPYCRQVVISTGKSNWGRFVTDEKGSLASYISDIEKAAPLTITGGASTPGIAPNLKSQAVSILNGSHDTLSKYNDNETVLVFPDYKVLTEVPRSLDGARELWRNSVSPSVSRLGSSSGTLLVQSSMDNEWWNENRWPMPGVPLSTELHSIEGLE